MLAARFMDGGARALVNANLMDVLHRLAGLGQNSAMQVSKGLTGVSCLLPFFVGLTVERYGMPLRFAVLSGYTTMCLATVGLAVVARGPGLPIVLCYVVFNFGLAPVLSCLPSIAKRVSWANLPAFMQRYFILLAAGSVMGSLAASQVRVFDVYAAGFSVAGLSFAAVIACLLAIPATTWARPTGVAGIAGIAGLARGPGCAWPDALKICALLVPFNMSYLQYMSSWYVQAEFMDQRVGAVTLSPAALQAVERLASVIALAMLEALWKTRRGEVLASNLSLRFSLGCGFEAAAMAASAVLELARRDRFGRLPGDPEVSSLHVTWQIPQFMLMAVAAGILYPAQTEWSGSSPALTGVMLLFQCASAVGLACALPLMTAWLPQTSPNEGRYDLFFGVLALACGASALSFLSLPRKLGAPDH